MKELDLSGVDEILNKPEEKELDLSGVDEIIKPSFLDRAIQKVTPSSETIQSAQDAGQTGLDFAQGVAGGATMGAMDELGGWLGAGVEKGLSYIPGTAAHDTEKVNRQLSLIGIKAPEETILDKYRTYQQGIQQEQNASAERSPIAHTLGQIGGGITSGMALGGALGLGGTAGKVESIADIARNSGKAQAAMELLKRGGMNYLKAAPAIAAESALTSQEHLIGPNANPMGVAADVAGGLLMGGAVMGGGQVLSDVGAPIVAGAKDKIAQAINSEPSLRHLKIAYNKYGQEYKVNPMNTTAIDEGMPGVFGQSKAIEGGTPFSLLNNKRAKEMTDDILATDHTLGEHVGQSLDLAKGIRVDASDILTDSHNDLINMANYNPQLLKDPQFNSLMTEVFSRNYKNASPREIKNTIESITGKIDKISSYKIPSPELEDALPILRKLRRELDSRLKDKVPAYKDAAERFSEHRRAYIEQPIAGKNDPEIDDIYYSDLKKGQQKLVDAYENMISNSTSMSRANETAEGNLSSLRESMKDFQNSELERAIKGKIQTPITKDYKQTIGQIKDYADDSAVRRDIRKTQDSTGGFKQIAKESAGFGGGIGKGIALGTAYRAGRVVGSAPVKGVVKVGKAIYNAPAQTLSNLASKLEGTPALASVGKALRESLETGNDAKKNAALFTIMQNPNARLLISHEDVEHESGE